MPHVPRRLRGTARQDRKRLVITYYTPQTPQQAARNRTNSYPPDSATSCMKKNRKKRSRSPKLAPSNPISPNHLLKRGEIVPAVVPRPSGPVPHYSTDREHQYPPPSRIRPIPPNLNTPRQTSPRRTSSTKYKTALLRQQQPEEIERRSATICSINNSRSHYPPTTNAQSTAQESPPQSRQSETSGTVWIDRRGQCETS